MPQRIVGIDLGTTNSALAWAEDRGPVRIFNVVQLVAPGEVERRSILPSFVYLASDAERDSGAVRLPWDAAPETVAGIFARDHGALTPGRQIASAKSWLSNALVDRTAALLPWTADDAARLSPVDASARILTHLRDAWNHEHPGEETRLEAQTIVLTVPASFDEEARELTVEAARKAGFDSLTLLEEPLAALYAWIAAHRRALPDTFGSGALILVCDVGGGTTDFSLIKAALVEGELEFERIAIGEHLLLGGDNVDLALAVAVEQKFGGAAKLALTQRETLRRKCSAAKERLLSDAVEHVPITLLGAGRGVVGGGVTAELTRREVEHALGDGFLPIAAPTDVPARDRRAGLRELGLPYETEPAITKHLAAFLARAGRSAGEMVRPDFVLFNGGFFKPALARERVLDCLAAWFGERPAVLDNEAPEAAVAVGAAFYGRLRRDPGASRRLLIRAGSARAYYIGVAADELASGRAAAVCVMPRGTQEGTRFELAREFTVTSNQPAQFTLYSSVDRDDPPNLVVTLTEGDVQKHAPLVTALRYGKRSRRVPLPVRLTTVFTETGTLELWCESRDTGHRWRLAFNLRAIESDPLDEAVPSSTDDEDGSPKVIVLDAALDAAAALIREVFGAPATRPPDMLTGELENLLGHGKHAWPLDAIRRLADVFLEVAEGRRRSSAHEARWLNLAGFCVRPGFGSALDAFRVGELRKVYAAGLTFAKDIQGQVEWLVLWQRVSAGFTAGQQRELAQRVAGAIGLGQRKPPRINPQIDRESWRLLAGLERLDAGQRAKLGGELLDRIAREPRNAAWLWAIARFGARTPLYGPLSSVVPPDTAEKWIERLLVLKQITPDVAAAIVQIGWRTGDPARDISPGTAQSAIKRMEQGSVDADAIEPLRRVLPPTRADAGRVFGESLPEGLRLAVTQTSPTPL